jgi:hypothetical protein
LSGAVGRKEYRDWEGTKIINEEYFVRLLVFLGYQLYITDLIC